MQMKCSRQNNTFARQSLHICSQQIQVRRALQASSADLPAGKLFSAVDSRLKHTPGSVFGSAALVAGTTVGAGILAVPFVTVDSGFVAASGAMTGLLCCLVY